MIIHPDRLFLPRLKQVHRLSRRSLVILSFPAWNLFAELLEILEETGENIQRLRAELTAEPTKEPATCAIPRPRRTLQARFGVCIEAGP